MKELLHQSISWNGKQLFSLATQKLLV